MIFFRKHKLKQARADWEAARDTLKAAERRGDTRAIHAATLAVRAANHRVMKLEVEHG